MENNIYSKLHEARKFIKTCGAKKQGKNKFSDYDYFTPEQISQLVFEACEAQKLIHLFDLTRNPEGCDGKLTVIDIESPDSKIVFNMATAIPKITATNETQQLGGAVTYTERYLLMTAFDIKDNNLDPDSNDNSSSASKKEQDNKVWLNKWNKDKSKSSALYWKVVKEARLKKKTVKDLREFYKINQEVAKELEKDLKE
jgi:hypothetical protein